MNYINALGCILKVWHCLHLGEAIVILSNGRGYKAEISLKKTIKIPPHIKHPLYLFISFFYCSSCSVFISVSVQLGHCNKITKPVFTSILTLTTFVPLLWNDVFTQLHELSHIYFTLFFLFRKECGYMHLVIKFKWNLCTITHIKDCVAVSFSHQITR